MSDTDTEVETTAPPSPEYAAAQAEIADLRAQLARVDELRDELDRLAPDNGHDPGHAELRSLLATARRVTNYPMVDRCGCGWTSTAPVEFHRRGSAQCKAAQ